MGVKLRPKHLEAIIEITQLICDYKHVALRKDKWNTFYNEYLLELVEQIKENDFKCHRADNSTLTWIIDQVCWSRKLVLGTNHKDGIPLADTPLGEYVLDICRNATLGQRHYDGWSRDSKFNDLFS
jgi:hypothetical protein